jgi:hypothetical protein
VVGKMTCWVGSGKQSPQKRSGVAQGSNWQWVANLECLANIYYISFTWGGQGCGGAESRIPELDTGPPTNKLMLKITV